MSWIPEPFWPVPVSISLLLLAVGLYKGAWRVPAAVVVGYAATRLTDVYLTAPTDEVEVTLIWIGVAVYLGIAHKAWFSAFFFGLSGSVYTILLVVFGENVAYLSISAILAEILALFGLIAIGGGLYGSRNPTPTRSTTYDISTANGALHNLLVYRLGMASRKAMSHK